MLIIIDGYNLLRKITGGGQSSQTQRSAFINVLGRYRALRGHKIVVVFDGGSSPMVQRERQRAVDLVFVGYRQTADEFIAAFVQEHKGKELLVVTADNGIRAVVQSGSVSVMDPLEFYQKVRETIEGTGTISKMPDTALIKTTDESTPELDSLMREAVRSMTAPQKKDESTNTSPTKLGRSRGLKKKERRHLKKIDKL